ncbi:MAG: radical SAM protein [Candidatus Eremiobacteraeota bacterium]|nr:radical SAM protein [Candidatus Eremiobacteraeota bacterium]
MHFTFHLTTGCTMRCDYCYSPPLARLDMTEETARQAMEFAVTTQPKHSGIVFYGGEPLLRKDIIRLVVALAKDAEEKHGHRFHFKLTTNGILLDEEFLEFAGCENIAVSLSMDGDARSHDCHRKTADGRGTFSIVDEKASMLLKWQPYTHAMMVVTPATLDYFHDSVKFLLEKGFRYILLSLDYRGVWTDNDLRRLRKQYGLLAKLYERLTLEEHKFYFGPFDVKIAGHIHGAGALCERCHGGVKQVSVAPDGGLYPCVAFVQDCVSTEEFRIGDVRRGFDDGKRTALFQRAHAAKESCRGCAIEERCHSRCGCINWQSAGDIAMVSPVLCETERIVIPVADRLARRLYRKKAPMFIQKHYNPAYPVISLLEDLQGL